MKYPTEVKWGEVGYKKFGGAGLSKAEFNQILDDTPIDVFPERDIRDMYREYQRQKAAEQRATVAGIRNAERFGVPSTHFEDRTGRPQEPLFEPEDFDRRSNRPPYRFKGPDYPDQPPRKPGGPGPIDPAWYEEFKFLLDMANAMSEWLRDLNRENPFLKASRRSVWGFGFFLGWDIGTMLWGFPPIGDPVPPGGWWSPDWCFAQCASPTNAHIRYANVYGGLYADNGLCNGLNYSFCGGNLLGNETDPSVFAPDNPIDAFAKATPLSFSGVQFGTYWYRGVGTPATWYQDEPGTLTRVRTYAPGQWYETEFPDEFPITQPTGVPAPQAWPDALPQPFEQPEWDAPHRTGNPKPGVRTLPPFPPNFPPGILVPPTDGVAPTVPPVVVLEPSPGGGGLRFGQRRGKAASNQPPRKKDWEKKLGRGKRGLAAQAVYVAVNFATEYLDFFDSVYKGIPRELKSGKDFCAVHDYKCKMAAVWRHREKIEWGTVINEFVNNEIEDMMFGLLGMATGKVSRNLNVTTGVSRGTKQQEQVSEKELKRYYDDPLTPEDESEGMDLEVDKTGLLPELHFDEKTGIGSITWPLVGYVG